jgi:uncharacterized RDD family membrane protein YckC
MEYQGIGPRFVAQLIDAIILWVVFFILGFAMAGTFTFDFYGTAALPFLGIWAIISVLYFAVLEGTTGATVGKKIAKIKVVQEDGKPCGMGPSLIRNILRIIDALPFLYIIGLIFMSRSDKKQRLGDKIAKTVVVKI